MSGITLVYTPVASRLGQISVSLAVADLLDAVEMTKVAVDRLPCRFRARKLIVELVERGRRPQEDAPDPHLKILLPRTDSGEIKKLVHRQAEFRGYLRHLVKNIEQPPVELVKIFVEEVNCDDDPISVAIITLLEHRVRFTDDKFLKQIDAFVREVGELGGPYSTRSRFSHS